MRTITTMMMMFSVLMDSHLLLEYYAVYEGAVIVR
jgi:hypothetical protein